MSIFALFHGVWLINMDTICTCYPVFPASDSRFPTYSTLAGRPALQDCEMFNIFGRISGIVICLSCPLFSASAAFFCAGCPVPPAVQQSSEGLFRNRKGEACVHASPLISGLIQPAVTSLLRQITSSQRRMLRFPWSEPGRSCSGRRRCRYQQHRRSEQSRPC